MPLYDYKCAQCGRVAEVRHGFDQRWDEPCAVCGGTLVRVFNPAPIVFKGSGFYVTDSRGKKAAATAKAETKPADASASDAKPSEPASPAGKPEAKTSGDAKAAEPAA